MSAPRAWLVAYDITDARRLRRVHRICGRYGEPLQRSVFLCRLHGDQLLALQTALAHVIRPGADRVRYQPLCETDIRRALALGAQALPGEIRWTWVV